MLTGENILAGMVLGVTAGIQPGPLAALVVRAASRSGFAAGARVAFAPILSDGPIVLLAVAIQRYFIRLKFPLAIFALCAALYCLWLARQTWCLDVYQSPKTPTPDRSFRQAVVVNLLNPNPYIFWLTVGAAYISRGGLLAGSAFVIAFLLAIVGTKICIAWIIARASLQRRPQIGMWIGRILALALVIFALRLFYQAWAAA